MIGQPNRATPLATNGSAAGTDHSLLGRSGSAVDLLVDARSGFATWTGHRCRCAIGRNGIAAGKSEGDGASPIGRWPVRRVLFRPDRVAMPRTDLPVAAIRPTDGWCDAPEHALYNRQVTLPFAASHERLWREDGVYDVLAVLGHNDDPAIQGAGSAIFLHVATADWRGTAGCVALSLVELLALLAEMRPGSTVTIPPS